MKKSDKIYGKFLSLLVVLELFVTEDVLVFGTLDSSKLINFRYGVQIVCFLLMLVFVKRIKITKDFYAITFLSGIVLISGLINLDFRLGYLFLVMIYLSVFLCLQLIDIDAIMELFYKSMVFICLYSLVVYGIRVFFPGFLSHFPIITNVANIDFYFCGLSNAIVHPGGLIRNYGPFREPGVFQMFVVIALIYCLFKKEKINIFNSIILIITLCTTFSTTGYIALFLLLAAFLFHNNKINKTAKFCILLVTFAGIAYLTFGTDLMYKQGYGSVFGKLFGAYDSISMAARKASIVVNLKMFLRRPILGNGISYVDESFSQITYSIFSVITHDNTNTLLIQLSRFGIVFAVLFIRRYIQFFWNHFKTNSTTKILIILAFFVLLFGENLSYSFLIALFLAVPQSKLDYLTEVKKNEGIVVS